TARRTNRQGCRAFPGGPAWTARNKRECIMEAAADLVAQRQAIIDRMQQRLADLMASNDVEKALEFWSGYFDEEGRLKSELTMISRLDKTRRRFAPTIDMTPITTIKPERGGDGRRDEASLLFLARSDRRRGGLHSPFLLSQEYC